MVLAVVTCCARLRCDRQQATLYVEDIGVAVDGRGSARHDAWTPFPLPPRAVAPPCARNLWHVNVVARAGFVALALLVWGAQPIVPGP